VGIKVDTSGFDELQRRVKKLDGTHEVSVDKLFTPAFMAKYTDYSDFGQMLDVLGIADAEEFKAYPDTAMDEHVRQTTRFESWEAMLSQAVANYASGELGL
jgi:hypothetical protein